MGIFDNADFTIDEKARRGLPLPDKLSIFDLVNLWVTTDRDREIYYKILLDAYEKNTLSGTKQFEDGQYNPYTMYEDGSTFIIGGDVSAIYQNIDITKDAFITWLKNEGEPLPANCLLVNWFSTTGIQNESLFIDGQDSTKQTGKNTNQVSNKITTFDKRLDALKNWLKDDLNYSLACEIIILPKQYTLESVYTKLCEKNGSLFLGIELSSFDAHFWGKQKIVELMRGNKTAIM